VIYSALRIKTQPAIEPVDVSLAKQHLRVDTDADDALISGMIVSARAMVEQWTGRAMITQTLVWTFSDTWGGALAYNLPRSPASAVNTVSQLASDGSSVALPADQYVAFLASEPAKVTFVAAPADGTQYAQIEFVAGYGDTAADVPAPLQQAILMVVGYTYEHRGDEADTGSLAMRVGAYLAAYGLTFFGV
jgi:uncharacterized phiE125 gp8 family phage protein